MQTSTILAIIAIALSALSLAWQGYSWLRTGPRLSARLTNEAETIRLVVTNRGRMAITIREIHLYVMPARTMWQALKQALNVVQLDWNSLERQIDDTCPTLPFRLDSFDDEIWSVDVSRDRARELATARILGWPVRSQRIVADVLPATGDWLTVVHRRGGW